LLQAHRVVTMGQLTASIAHEVRQPLSATALDAEAALRWLGRNAPKIEEANACLEDLIKHNNRAIEIIERIHRFVKGGGPQIVRLDMNEPIVEVIRLAHGEFVKNGVTVRTELGDSLPPIQGDRVQLQQVMLNLVINAIQAMSDVRDSKRELDVTTGVVESGESVRVAVRDTGPGPSAENVEGLFQPFYTTKPDGIGVGLSICRSIIEDNRGRLWASRIEPQGALFQFTIPATQPGCSPITTMRES
jgi:C4-dicarboxylate-specific signal transduction histidine kinase